MTLVYLLAVLAVLVPAVMTPPAMRRLAPSVAAGVLAGRVRTAAAGLVRTLGAVPAAAGRLVPSNGPGQPVSTGVAR